jgi:hypothetical protein
MKSINVIDEKEDVANSSKETNHAQRINKIHNQRV